MGEVGPSGADRSLDERRSPKASIDPATLYRVPPRILVERLGEGDPLDLRYRCELRRRALAYLISIDRLYCRVLARVAMAGALYRGAPPLDAWLEELVDRSISEILDEDETLLLRGHPPEVEDFRALVQSFELTPAQAVECCVSFNGGPPDVREVFFATALDGDSIADVALRLGASPTDVREALASVMRLFDGSDTGARPRALPLESWPADW